MCGNNAGAIVGKVELRNHKPDKPMGTFDRRELVRETWLPQLTKWLLPQFEDYANCAKLRSYIAARMHSRVDYIEC